MEKQKIRTKNSLFYGLYPIFIKELIHISRNMPLIIFTIVMTGTQLLFLGYAIDTNVRQVKTVVLDLSQTQESRTLIERFVSTDDFNVIKIVYSDRDLQESIASGKTRVGIKIPQDYATRLLNGETTNVLVLIDGSNSIVTTEVIGAANGLILRESLKTVLSRLSQSSNTIPIELRSTILFNPDTRSPNFIIPGLMACQVQAIVLVFGAAAIAQERERKTLDQLYVTPANPLGVVLGKMLPYGLFAFVQEAEILLIGYFIFDVPFQGSYPLLLLFTIPFVVLCLGIGLLVSVKAATAFDAMRITTAFELLTIFLSGLVFERENMPRIFQLIGELFPATHFIEISRGIMLRGVGYEYLWQSAAIMLVMGIGVTALAAWQYKTRGT